MIKDQVITKQDLLDALMMSAREFKLPVVSEWHKEWSRIVTVIRELHPDLPGFDRESFLIDSLLTSGKYAVDHSDEYIREYDPHYRIIYRQYFEMLVLKKSPVRIP